MLLSINKGRKLPYVGTSVINYTRDGVCSCCAECCSDILPLTLKEIDRISDYMDENNIKPKSRVRFSPGITLDMRCPFIDDTNKVCMIYPVKPDICKKFICSQSINVIEGNKRLIYERRGNLLISMHVTFLRDEFFYGYYASEPLLSKVLADVEIEVVDVNTVREGDII